MDGVKIPRNAVILAGVKAHLELVDAEGVVTRVSVPAGRHRASFWADLVEPSGGYLKLPVGSDCAVFLPASGVKIQEPPGMFDSGANPDFKPVTLTEAEGRARAMFARIQTESDALERKMKAWAKIETVPRAPEGAADGPAKEDAPVVE